MKNYVNRELSYLKFNERVLDKSLDDKIPILERLGFYSIFHSNLDEFFMIRVGSLNHAAFIKNKISRDEKTGWSNDKQLNKIYARAKELYKKSNDIFLSLNENLAANKLIICHDIGGLATAEQNRAENFFRREIMPCTKVKRINSSTDFRDFKNLRTYGFARISHTHGENSSKKSFYAAVKIDDCNKNTLILEGSGGDELCIIPFDVIFLKYVNLLFPDCHIGEKMLFRVTRNSDIDAEDILYDPKADIKELISEKIKKRLRNTAVRLEIYGKSKHSDATQFLCKKFALASTQSYFSPLLNLPAKGEIARAAHGKGFIENQELVYKKRVFVPAKNTDMRLGIIENILNQDILLIHPKNSLDDFFKLLGEAENDNKFLGIKITLYRVAEKSRVVDSLCRMAERGKDVTVFIELRAKFDEENNIKAAETLDKSGCKVYYHAAGRRRFKMHSKAALFTFGGIDGETHYIAHVGTGNYNEITAELYTDLGILTSDKRITTDISKFFDILINGGKKLSFKHILCSPHTLKREIIKNIKREIEYAEKCRSGYVAMKINSLSDSDVMAALVRASKAGVKIELLVRGICCLIPGIPAFSENIRVRSVIGRYLEHSRIYIFGGGDSRKIYISSADMMERNLSYRIETAIPILNNSLKDEVMRIFNNSFNDNVNGETLTGGLNYIRDEMTGGIGIIDSQELNF